MRRLVFALVAIAVICGEASGLPYIFVHSENLHVSRKSSHPGNSVSSPASEDAKRCNPGDIVVYSDKVCVCDSSGSDWDCTNNVHSEKLHVSRKSSHPENSVSSPASEEVKSCDPGDIVVYSDKVCVCDSSGTDWDCTNNVHSEKLHVSRKSSHPENSVSSPASEEVKSCDPGDIVVYSDKVCVCDSSGSDWDCTNNVHSEKLHVSRKSSHPENSVSSPASEKVKSCDPGDIVIYSDKVCVCDSSGSDWDCTNNVHSEKLHVSRKSSHPENSVSSPASEKVKSCDPGDIVVYSDKVCVCDSSGSDWDCTNNVHSEKLHVSRKSSHPGNSVSSPASEEVKSCDPGDIVVYSDKVCVCDSSGTDWDCTNNVHSEKLHVSRKSSHPGNSVSSPASEEVKSCDPGDIVVYSDKVCVCDSSGTDWDCTNNVHSEKLHVSRKSSHPENSVSSPASEEVKSCDPGDIVVYSDKVCVCDSSGSDWDCTNNVHSEKLHVSRKSSHPENSVSSPASEKVKSCNPGDIVIYSDKVCVCDSSGSDWDCTNNVHSEKLHVSRKSSHPENSVSSPASEEVKSCDPGDIVVYSDKVCVCDSSGSDWDCTNNVHSEKLHVSRKSSHPENSVSSPASEKVKSCNPGDIVIYSDKVCVCDSSGSDWDCTNNVHSEKLHVSRKSSHPGNSVSSLASEEVKSCDPGDIVVYSDKVCVCDSSGTDWDCTNNVHSEKLHVSRKSSHPGNSVSSPASEEVKSCDPGDIVVYSDKVCVCDSSGTDWDCTNNVHSEKLHVSRKSSHPENSVSSPASEKVKSCDPGDIVVYSDKVCVCDSSGSDWDCTNNVHSEKLHVSRKSSHPENSVSSPASEEVKSCDPGDIVVYSDKVCVCDSSGSDWDCTNNVHTEKLHVSRKSFHPENSVSSPTSEEAQICNPLDVVVYSDTVCICDTSGSSWYCY